MKNAFKLIAAAILGVAVASCSSAEKMAEMAENVKVTSNPAVLAVVAGQVNADITVTYPADYFHPKAILTVTPVVVYEGGELALSPYMYQGEKVKDNYKVVPKAGGVVKEHISFPFQSGMEKCYLELRGVVSYKSKTITLPTKKVADGCNITALLANDKDFVSYKSDNYQEVISMTKEGQILYTVNSSEVRSKELKGNSIKNFQAALDDIKANERMELKSTEVVAYASPEGGEKLNSKLSDKRAESAEKAWTKVVKGHEATDPEVKSIGQDWEGFQQLVSSSDIQDKDLILRVLSMYSDPAVREQEIRNMSEVFSELKSDVLPELRRARFIANVEYTNYSSDELKSLIDQNIDVLDEEALLRAASLVEGTQKLDIYNKAVEKYGSDRAQYNIGVYYILNGDNDKAAKALASVKDTEDADLANALGVLALRSGDKELASKYFKTSGTKDAQANQVVIDIENGNYAKAASEVKNVECPSLKGLAYILNNQLPEASSALKSDDCAMASYLKAIIAARSGNAADVKSNLAAASANSYLAARATKDIEFAAY